MESVRWLCLLIVLAACGGSARANPRTPDDTQARPARQHRRERAEPARVRPAKAKDGATTGSDAKAEAETNDETDDKAEAKTDEIAFEPGATERGEAAWYGGELHGSPTASGERFDKRKLTAAHRTLPLGAMVRVTNEKNGKSVELRINDRGPYGKRRRIIDVSEAAARILGFIDAGRCAVVIEILSLPRARGRSGSAEATSSSNATTDERGAAAATKGPSAK